jgi:hypothetical protein
VFSLTSLGVFTEVSDLVVDIGEVRKITEGSALIDANA